MVITRNGGHYQKMSGYTYSIYESQKMAFDMLKLRLMVLMALYSFQITGINQITPSIIQTKKNPVLIAIL